jgi:hypothetical protein
MISPFIVRLSFLSGIFKLILFRFTLTSIDHAGREQTSFENRILDQSRKQRRNLNREAPLRAKFRAYRKILSSDPDLHGQHPELGDLRRRPAAVQRLPSRFQSTGSDLNIRRSPFAPEA